MVRDTQQPERNVLPGKSAKKKSAPDMTLARENHLAHLVQGGSEAALLEVYERFFQPLYSYFYRRIGNELEAEDLTSATFFQALQGLRAGVTFTRGCGPWLFGIAATVLLAWRAGTPQGGWLVLSIAELEDQGQRVLNEILAREKTSLLWHLVERLPSDFQQVLTLRYKNELSYREIALQMKCTVNQCKTIHGRAMKKLRDIVHKEYGEAFSIHEPLPLKDL